MDVSRVGQWQRWRWFLLSLGLVAASASLFWLLPSLARYTQTRTLSPLNSPPATSMVAPPLPHYTPALTLGQGMEWRFAPLVVDVNGDGTQDLVATARIADPALYLWRGDGHTLTPTLPTWSNIGYAALTTGDINHDGFPDLVGASHFGKVQTLLSDGQGGVTELIMQGQDGYVAAQLADVNSDGAPDLVLLGFARAGIEIYLGDGHGHWTQPTRLPDPPVGRTMPGRDLVVGDLNHDGHVDIVAAFNRWGLYLYYGDGQGGFIGGPADFMPPRVFSSIAVSLALGDVNHDGHPDLVINGTTWGREEVNGPEVYLGDGREGWHTASTGLKVLKMAMGGLALGDLDQDGHVDLMVGGKVRDNLQSGYGLFWFRGDDQGGWHLVSESESGLPTQGLAIPYGVALADLDRNGVPEIITLHGGAGNITIWKRQEARDGVMLPRSQAATRTECCSNDG